MVSPVILATGVSIWQIIQTIAMIVIPLLSAVVTAFYWLHQRVSVIEGHSKETSGAIYGREDDPLQVGLAKEVNDLKNRVNKLNTRVEDISERVERIEKE